MASPPPPGTASHIRMADDNLPPTERVRARFRLRSVVSRNALSEFVGTALLLFIGTGVVFQHVLPQLPTDKVTIGVQVQLGWGLALAFAIYVTYHTSGGQLNPAVSFALFLLGKLSFPELIINSIAQLAGAFTGSLVAYLLYLDQFRKYVRDSRTILGTYATAGCFTSFPDLGVSNWTAFFDQVFGTGLLVFFIIAILDKRNRIPQAAHPLLFGLVLVMIGLSFGLNLGYPINPARDLGPRILTYFIYKSGAFTYHDYYFWIPILAPFVGAAVAVLFYLFAIGAHVPDVVVVERVITDEAKQPLKNGEDV